MPSTPSRYSNLPALAQPSFGLVLLVDGVLLDTTTPTLLPTAADTLRYLAGRFFATASGQHQSPPATMHHHVVANRRAGLADRHQVTALESALSCTTAPPKLSLRPAPFAWFTGPATGRLDATSRLHGRNVLVVGDVRHATTDEYALDWYRRFCQRTGGHGHGDGGRFDPTWAGCTTRFLTPAEYDDAPPRPDARRPRIHAVLVLAPSVQPELDYELVAEVLARHPTSTRVYLCTEDFARVAAGKVPLLSRRAFVRLMEGALAQQKFGAERMHRFRRAHFLGAMEKKDDEPNQAGTTDLYGACEQRFLALARRNLLKEALSTVYLVTDRRAVDLLALRRYRSPVGAAWKVLLVDTERPVRSRIVRVAVDGAGPDLELEAEEAFGSVAEAVGWVLRREGHADRVPLFMRPAMGGLTLQETARRGSDDDDDNDDDDDDEDEDEDCLAPREAVLGLGGADEEEDSEWETDVCFSTVGVND